MSGRLTFKGSLSKPTFCEVFAMIVNNCNFLFDLVTLLREKAIEAKIAANTGGDYENGRHFAYYEVLSLIQQQAQAFGIEIVNIGMSEFDPEKDVL